jgi:hypothetical protein
VIGVLELIGDLSGLRTPTLVAAFEGWNDAGECATLALDAVVRATGAEVVGTFDAEALYDFQQTRPVIRRAEEGERVLDWPEMALLRGGRPTGRGDLLLLWGPEPNLRWRSFAGAVVDLAQMTEVGRIVTLGALQVDVPHTRPVPVTMTSSHPDLRRELALRPSSYEGPTGITGVLHATASAAGVPSLSMWGGVPHYLSATPYLRGALVLAERLAAILGVEVALEDLALDAAHQNDEIAELLEADEELSEYVVELEERAATAGDDIGEGLPEPEVSGEDLVAELERYLRGER